MPKKRQMNKKQIKQAIETSENLIISFNATISLNSSSKKEFFDYIRNLKDKKINIYDFKKKYSNLFDGSLKNHFGKNLNPNNRDYEKKLKESLFGGVRRCYGYGEKSNFNNFSIFAKELKKAYLEEEEIESVPTFLKLVRMNNGTTNFSYRRYRTFRNIIDNWLIVRETLIFDKLELFLELLTTIKLKFYFSARNYKYYKNTNPIYTFNLRDFKYSDIKIKLILDVVDLFGNQLQINQELINYKNANIIEIKSKNQIFKDLNLNFKEQIKELDDYFLRCLNSVHYNITKSVLYVEWY